MNVTLEKLKAWMEAKENEHLEFKEAKNRYSPMSLLFDYRFNSASLSQKFVTKLRNVGNINGLY